jgi:hypothetical protein
LPDWLIGTTVKPWPKDAKRVAEVALVRSVEDPQPGRVWHQRSHLLIGGLHVLVVDQHMRERLVGYGQGWQRHVDRPVGRRVLAGVALQLVQHRRGQVHAGVFGHLQQVDLNVGDLLADVLLLRWVGRRGRRLVGGQPLEDLQQLGRFHHQGHRQVLGRVKARPVPHRGEVAHRGLQGLDVHGRVSGERAQLRQAHLATGTDRPHSRHSNLPLC